MSEVYYMKAFTCHCQFCGRGFVRPGLRSQHERIAHAQERRDQPWRCLTLRFGAEP